MTITYSPRVADQRKAIVTSLVSARYIDDRAEHICETLCERIGERPYHLIENDYQYDTIWARTDEDAADELVANFAPSVYDTSDGPVWVSGKAVDALTDETVGEFEEAVEPDEPECSEDEHDWRSPHDVVGGVEENPGVHGHGGGVVIHEVCRHCGCHKITDTWAQRMDTGEQGLTSVTYTFEAP